MMSFQHLWSSLKRWLIPSLMGLSALVTFSSQATDIGGEHEQKNEWVVVLKDPRPARLQGFNVKGYTGRNYKNSQFLNRYGKRVSKEFGLELKKAWFIDSLKVYCLIVELNASDEQTLIDLKADQRVEWVQASNEFTLLSTSANRYLTPQGGPQSGAQSKRQTVLNADGRGVKIALIDSAVARDHPDLSNAVRQRKDVVIGGIASSAKGEPHGTAMAGILVATPQNELGLAGVAPAADVYAFRGCWEADNSTQCNTLSLARALDGVLQTDASILNLSLSGPEDLLLDRILDKLIEQGVLVVAAFDPQRPQSARFPSRRSGVLIVRAKTMNEDFQNEFTAPGKRIVVAPNGGYTLMSGHSVAAAYTSGVLALLTQQQAQNTAAKTREANGDLMQKIRDAQISNATQLMEFGRQLY